MSPDGLLFPTSAEATAMSVSQLTVRIKDALQTSFSSVYVVGEISNLSCPRSGHVYMTLKDQGAQLKAVIWRSSVARINFDIQDGMEVLCRGDIDVYPPHGTYQLIVRRIEPLGEGALQLALKQLRQKLAGEGLFNAEHKKSLPLFPGYVAIVTSPTGAAIHDFLQVATRRWRGSRIDVIPARVQGARAAEEIVAGIKAANRLHPSPDVLVVARGGGSLEDLWCFNVERVARAIFASQIPVVSAVGHEIDVTLSDLVADVRALTPTEAAELVLPSADELRDRLIQNGRRMAALVCSRIEGARTRLHGIEQRRVMRIPMDRIQNLARTVDDLELRSNRAVRVCLAKARDRTATLSGKLESLSPLATLERGYSITLKDLDASVVGDASSLETGQLIRSRFARGSVISRVEQIDS